jgi:hypothetical protein
MIVWGGSELRSGGQLRLGQAQDDDADGLAECEGDCDDGDPSTLDVPEEVTLLTVEAAPTLIHFESQDGSMGESTTYSMVAGKLSDLAGTGDFDLAWCVGSFPDSPATDGAADPAPGNGYYYLIRAGNGCGTASYGSGSDGVERAIDVCP